VRTEPSGKGWIPQNQRAIKGKARARPEARRLTESKLTGKEEEICQPLGQRSPARLSGPQGGGDSQKPKTLLNLKLVDALIGGLQPKTALTGEDQWSVEEKLDRSGDIFEVE